MDNSYNSLLDIVKDFGKRCKKDRTKSDPMSINFPRVTENYIQSLTFGIYQLKQVK